MPSGGKLSAEIVDAGDAEIKIRLADTGMGLNDAQREKIFEPFQAGFINGTGLGLAIVYQIIQAHRGSIQVGSGPGKGTQFLIAIPKSQPS
jgi:signal transduction histidine kinase